MEIAVNEKDGTSDIILFFKCAVDGQAVVVCLTAVPYFNPSKLFRNYGHAVKYKTNAKYIKQLLIITKDTWLVFMRELEWWWGKKAEVLP